MSEIKDSEYSKNWELAADGIYRYKPSGTYFERPKVNGCYTYRSLKTKNLKLAKEELRKRKSGNHEYEKEATITVGEIIRR